MKAVEAGQQGTRTDIGGEGGLFTVTLGTVCHIGPRKKPFPCPAEISVPHVLYLLGNIRTHKLLQTLPLAGLVTVPMPPTASEYLLFTCSLGYKIWQNSQYGIQ